MTHDSSSTSVVSSMPAPSWAHILCLDGPASLAAAAATTLRARFAASHMVELLREPSDVTAVIRSLQRAGRQDGGKVEVIVTEATGEDSAEAALLWSHWPAARRVLLGKREPTAAPVASPTPSALPPGMAEALATEVGAAVEEYRRHQ